MIWVSQRCLILVFHRHGPGGGADPVWSWYLIRTSLHCWLFGTSSDFLQEKHVKLVLDRMLAVLRKHEKLQSCLFTWLLTINKSPQSLFCSFVYRSYFLFFWTSPTTAWLCRRTCRYTKTTHAHISLWGGPLHLRGDAAVWADGDFDFGLTSLWGSRRDAWERKTAHWEVTEDVLGSLETLPQVASTVRTSLSGFYTSRGNIFLFNKWIMTR